MEDNKTQDWTVGWKFTQQKKNCSYHAGINQTPYKAMFGEEPKVGLTSSNLPHEVLVRLQYEEDLLALLQTPAPKTGNDDELLPTTACDNNNLPSSSASNNIEPLPSNSTEYNIEAPNCSTTEAPLHNINKPESNEITAPEAGDSITDLPFDADVQSKSVDQRIECIANQRKRTCESELAQAERMVKRSRIELKAGQIGDNVAVPIPMVDRGRDDPRNILGVIVDKDENNLYRIAVKDGI